ncbi:hypothetical protein GCM10012275_23640 [Longimycelium tulufanense]|uniref:Uncharacterized protein n=1 Tax=Longimycelium tulufanense TaxID=907463 RepID=A0A8J3CF98_9PSEU|nr:hypothetical protein [Longimycelium tulufanense]GGM51966.1 hypothetical protein GCM10012275_23640 [Longimycelium tulufanense]
MAGTRDLARKGRARRLVLVLLPFLALAMLPRVLVAHYRDRLPERAYVDGWARMMERVPDLAPSWDRWAHNHLGVLLGAAVIVGLFVWRWEYPTGQRLMVLMSWGGAGSAAVATALKVGAALDATHAAVTLAWWWGLLNFGLMVVGAVVGWLLSGPKPRLPDAMLKPPVTAPRLRLGATERAVFTASLRSTQQLMWGSTFLGLALMASCIDVGPPGITPLYMLLGLLMLSQATARLRITREGVCLALPWLGRLTRLVQYRHIQSASVTRQKASLQCLAGVGDGPVFGYTGRTGPALTLHLSDGRRFVATVDDAETAAALVNAELDRQRGPCATADQKSVPC